MRKFLRAVILVVGILLFFSLDIITAISNRKYGQLAAEFDEVNSAAVSGEITDAGGTDDDGIVRGSPELLSQIEEYNLDLATNGQHFTDAWSMAQSPIDISELEDGLFGYVTIPAMDVELPLYVGASTENMAKGAAILGQTSLPIGGVNTNCVIAGHRGYRGQAFFKEIEELAIGDFVYVTNPWETLTYRVESIDVIDPDDSDKILIQEGRDMVTLLTCHPYRSHGKYRYLVYCVRDEGGDAVIDSSESATVTTDAITTADGTVYESSARDIRLEKTIPPLCGLVIILVFVLTCIPGWRKRKRQA